MKNKIWINGKFADENNAKISVFDRGFLYGDGAFETMRSYAGVVFKLEGHLSRLFSALNILKITSPYSMKYFKDVVYKSLEINDLTSAYIRVAVTRGEGRFGIHYSDHFRPNVVVVAKEFGDYPPWMYSKGISAGVVTIRQNEYSPASGIKSLNFLNYILARFQAKEKAYDEAILANTKGHIAEAATSNIFLVKKEAIMTPSLDSGIVAGITREVILRIARRLRLDTEEKKVSYKELLSSDEVFLTNSLVEVLPVTSIDARRVGKGVPGDLTKLLHISYQKEVIREALL
jgi:branched-chain amino acid aminotransferase